MLRPRSQCACKRTWICVSGSTCFSFVVLQFFSCARLGHSLVYEPHIGNLVSSRKKLLLFKLFFCPLFSTLCSMPCVLHKSSATLQPLYHLLGIVKCGPDSSGILNFLIFYNVQSDWLSGIRLVSFIVHIVHHHSTVMKFYRVQHQLCCIAPLLEGLVS